MKQLGAAKDTAEIIHYTTEFKYTSLGPNFFGVKPKSNTMVLCII